MSQTVVASPRMRITGSRLPTGRKYFFSSCYRGLRSSPLQLLSPTTVPAAPPSSTESSACSLRPSTITARQPAADGVQAGLDLGNHTAFDHARLHAGVRASSADNRRQRLPVAITTPGTSVMKTSQRGPDGAGDCAGGSVGVDVQQLPRRLAVARTATRSARRPAPRRSRSTRSSRPGVHGCRPRRRSRASRRRRGSAACRRPRRKGRPQWTPSACSDATSCLFTSPPSTATTTSSDSASVTRRPSSKRVGTSSRFSQSLITAPPP